MNPANIKKGIWQQLQNGNKATYVKADFTLSASKDAISGMMHKKRKKPTRRKQTVKKVNGKAANQRIFARTW